MPAKERNTLRLVKWVPVKKRGLINPLEAINSNQR
jgi:hypothetical protein